MNRVLLAGIGSCTGTDDPLESWAGQLRNDGWEVVYMGWDLLAPQVVQTAVQEDVDTIGLCGAGRSAISEIRTLLTREGAEDITVLVHDGVTPPTPPDRGRPW